MQRVHLPPIPQNDGRLYLNISSTAPSPATCSNGYTNHHHRQDGPPMSFKPYERDGSPGQAFKYIIKSGHS